MEQDSIDSDLAKLIAKTQSINCDELFCSYEESFSEAAQLATRVLVGKVIS